MFPVIFPSCIDFPSVKNGVAEHYEDMTLFEQYVKLVHGDTFQLDDWGVFGVGRISEWTSRASGFIRGMTVWSSHT